MGFCSSLARSVQKNRLCVFSQPSRTRLLSKLCSRCLKVRPTQLMFPSRALLRYRRYTRAFSQRNSLACPVGVSQKSRPRAAGSAIRPRESLDTKFHVSFRVLDCGQHFSSQASPTVDRGRITGVGLTGRRATICVVRRGRPFPPLKCPVHPGQTLGVGERLFTREMKALIVSSSQADEQRREVPPCEPQASVKPQGSRIIGNCSVAVALHLPSKKRRLESYFREFAVFKALEMSSSYL